MMNRKKVYTKNILSFILCYCVVFICFFSISCTDSTPSISTVQHTLIYDFYDEQLTSQISFSIFVEPLSDYRRAKEIHVKHNSTEFEWIISNPILNELNGSYYLGYSALFPQLDEEMPLGSYTVTYIDNADRECSYIIVISDLPSIKISNIAEIRAQDVINNTHGKECNIVKMIIYDDSGNELFFGDKSEDLETKEDILTSFPLAESYRECRLNNNSTIAILLPRILINEEPTEDISNSEDTENIQENSTIDTPVNSNIKEETSTL